MTSEVEPHWPRNAAVCHELWLAGIDPRDVVEGELTTKGYMVLGLHLELGVPIIESDNPVRTFVEWPSADVADRVLVAVQRQFMKKFYPQKDEN